MQIQKRRELSERTRVKENQRHLEMVTFKHEDLLYYERYPIKPGLAFIKAIVKHKHYTLKVTIPPMVGYLEERFYMFTTK